MNPFTFAPLVLKQIVRHRVRTLLTASGIAIAMFLFTAVQAMQQGVEAATRQKADDTTLVVYRKDRYCPATSILPQDYLSRIERVEGVVGVIPMKVVVSNCRTSLDVVTFRGVPRDDFLRDKRGQIEVIDDGPGLPEHIKDDIFDPFVSGRENGTGLGLALVSKIISEHQGWISVTSVPGRTIFRLSLPVAPPDLAMMGG